MVGPYIGSVDIIGAITASITGAAIKDGISGITASVVSGAPTTANNALVVAISPFTTISAAVTSVPIKDGVSTTLASVVTAAPTTGNNALVVAISPFTTISAAVTSVPIKDGAAEILASVVTGAPTTGNNALVVALSPLSGTMGVSGTIAASQSGTWTVGVSGTPAVNVTFPATQAVSGTVGATQSGTWNVAVTGNPAVNVTFPATQAVSGTVAATQSGTWTVGVSGNPAVNVTFPATQAVSGTVAATQSGTWTVGVSGTPAVGVTFPATQGVSGAVTATDNITQIGGVALAFGQAAASGSIPVVLPATQVIAVSGVAGAPILVQSVQSYPVGDIPSVLAMQGLPGPDPWQVSTDLATHLYPPFAALVATVVPLPIVRAFTSQLMAAQIAVINTTAATATLVKGLLGQKIYVVGYYLVAGAATNLTFQDDSATPVVVSGQMNFAVNEGIVCHGSLESPVMKTTVPGAALNLVQSGTAQLGGTLTYYAF